jgi:tetratricopeptide (TPR) repeat protein
LTEPAHRTGERASVSCPACRYRAPDPLPACPACEAPLDAAARPPPFLGRARALAQLDARLDEVLRTEEVRLVGVVGPPGSGRSALMNAFRRRRANAFSTVRTLRMFGTSPPEALARLVFLLCGLDERWPAEQRRQVAGERLAALPPPIAATLEALLTPPAPWTHLDRAQLHAALSALLCTIHASLLVVVEAPPEAVAVLVEALRARPGPALVLCEASPSEAAPLDDRVVCERFDVSQICDLLGELAERAPAPEPLAQAVLAHCDGQVGAVREAAGALLAAGVAPAGRAGWILPDPLPPLTAASASARRLEALTPAQRRLLAGAALIGMHFHPALVAGLGTDVRFDGAAVAVASRAGLVTEGPGGMLAFIHPIDRAALAASVPQEVARASHALIAQRLLRRHGSEAAPALADHYEHAGEPHTAAVWRFLAGLRRWEQRDVGGARPWVERAAHALADAPAAARLGALEAAARMAVELGDEPAALGWWRLTEAAAAEAGDPRARADAHLGLGQLALDRDALDAARQAFEAARLHASGHPLLQAGALAGLGRVELAAGRLDAAEAHLDLALEACAAEGDRAAAAAVLVSLAALRRHRHQYEAALQALDTVRGWPADVSTRHEEALERTRVLLDAGRLDEAAEQLVDLRKDSTSLRFSAHVASLTALVAAARHQDDVARAALREAAWRVAPLPDTRIRAQLARVQALLELQPGTPDFGPALGPRHA